MRTTHYTILDVSPTAELDEIYIAHHKAQSALKHAVTMGNPEAQSQLRLVDLAYETLSDPDKRAAYDTSLAAEQTQIMSAVEVEEVVTPHHYLRTLLLGLLLAVLAFFWQEKSAERQARAAAEAAQRAEAPRERATAPPAAATATGTGSTAAPK